MRKTVGLIMGLVALGLLIPGVLLVFSITGGWSMAVVLLAVSVLAAVVLAVIGAVFAAVQNKKAGVMFLCAAVAAVLNLALTLYLSLTLEPALITSALAAIILFAAARVVSPRT